MPPWHSIYATLNVPVMCTDCLAHALLDGIQTIWDIRNKSAAPPPIDSLNILGASADASWLQLSSTLGLPFGVEAQLPLMRWRVVGRGRGQSKPIVNVTTSPANVSGSHVQLMVQVEAPQASGLSFLYGCLLHTILDELELLLLPLCGGSALMDFLCQFQLVKKLIQPHQQQQLQSEPWRLMGIPLFSV